MIEWKRLDTNKNMEDKKMKSKFLKTVALATCLTVAMPANVYFANSTTIKAET